jgi:hypothetical protein
MVQVYAFLIKNDRRTIEAIPEQYKIPVAEYLAKQVEEVQ